MGSDVLWVMAAAVAGERLGLRDGARCQRERERGGARAVVSKGNWTVVFNPTRVPIQERQMSHGLIRGGYCCWP